MENVRVSAFEINKSRTFKIILDVISLYFYFSDIVARADCVLNNTTDQVIDVIMKGKTREEEMAGMTKKRLAPKTTIKTKVLIKHNFICVQATAVLAHNPAEKCLLNEHEKLMVDIDPGDKVKIRIERRRR